MTASTEPDSRGQRWTSLRPALLAALAAFVSAFCLTVAIPATAPAPAPGLVVVQPMPAPASPVAPAAPTTQPVTSAAEAAPVLEPLVVLPADKAPPAAKRVRPAGAPSGARKDSKAIQRRYGI